MDFSEYFSPIDIEKISEGEDFSKGTLGKIIQIYSEKKIFPETEKIHLAIIGVEEDRRALKNKGCSKAPDEVRKYLYKLSAGSYANKIVDLGNIKSGHTVEDTYFALQDVLHNLIKKNIVPIIIGGSQDLSFANYLAYKDIEATINIVSVDSRIDIADAESELNSQSFLGKIIMHQPNHLFNFSNIGYQSYFVNQTSLELMNKLFFDAHRLGQIRANMENAEPIIRHADMMSFDISAIRFTDAPANNYSSPNGFYGEEACQLTRYAGMSDKLSSIGFYEINSLVDKNSQTAHLVAQMIWYFIDGYYNRKNDFPFKKTSDYTKFKVLIKDGKYEIVFYKSIKSDRWWMEVPYPSDKRLKFERHHLVPCSYQDYEIAVNDDMPDMWWQTFQKLS